jgi:hypothetical protein
VTKIDTKVFREPKVPLTMLLPMYVQVSQKHFLHTRITIIITIVELSLDITQFDHLGRTRFIPYLIYLD